SDRRQGAAELEIGVVLVAQAALQPPAHARQLRGVERQALLLRHLDRHRAELAQPARAAELTPARPDAAEALGLVAVADLLNLDSQVEGLGEIADEIAEVHPVVGKEVEDHLRAVEDALGLDQLHRQASLADAMGADPLRIASAALIRLLARELAVIGLLDHA